MVPIVVGDLAVKVVGLLTPYLIEKGKEKFIDIGEEACKKTELFLEFLRKKWLKDKGPAFVLNKFEEQPEAFKDSFTAILKEKMEKDPELVKSIENYVKDVGPQLNVKFESEETENSTVLELKKFKSGKTNVDSNIKKSKNNIIVKIDEMG